MPGRAPPTELWYLEATRKDRLRSAEKVDGELSSAGAPVPAMEDNAVSSNVSSVLGSLSDSSRILQAHNSTGSGATERAKKACICPHGWPFILAVQKGNI